MTSDELREFIEERLSMSHVYQPVMLLTLLRAGGIASEEHIAREILAMDESQVEYYRQRVRGMVGRVLTGHGVVRRNGEFWHLDADGMTAGENAALRSLLEAKLAAFLETTDPWSHRRAGSAVSPSKRYEALRLSGGKCALCGRGADEVVLEVDHIVPRSRGGTDNQENLQVLCRECNSGKSNRDDTDFREAP